LKSWKPLKSSLPLRLTAAALFTVGFIYLSIYSLTPEMLNSEPENIIEMEAIMDLKDSAGQFLWRVGESMNIDLNRIKL